MPLRHLQSRVFRVDDRGNTLPYLLHLPAAYHAGTGSWPLVLFLHGASERGDDPADLLAHGPVRQAEAGLDLPFVLLAPQCPGYSTWACELTGVSALLDRVVDEHRVDADRVCVTGLSMGGAGTWAIGARYPHRFAALVPICGAWMPEAAPRLAGTPVWAFHGEDDDNIPIAHTEQMVAALEELGAPVRFTRYPGVTHDSWTRTYDDPEVYAWMTRQRRSTTD